MEKNTPSFIVRAQQVFSHRAPQHFTLILLYVVFAYYILINGEGLMGQWQTSWTHAVLIYLVGVNAFIRLTDEIPLDLRKPLRSSLTGFLFGFSIFFLLFNILHMLGFMFQDTVPPAYTMVIPLLVFQFIVCTSEEIIFRGALFRLFYRIHWLFAYLVSSLLFALFHWMAYGGSWIPLLMAFLMGVILCWLTKKYSLGWSIALHYTYNLSVLGVLLICAYTL